MKPILFFLGLGFGIEKYLVSLNFGFCFNIPDDDDLIEGEKSLSEPRPLI